MENLNLKRFKEESIKHGFDFSFKPTKITIKSYDSVVLYDVFELFKTTDGMTIMINVDASYIAIGEKDNWTEIKIRSIPHILNVLKSVYSD